MVEVGGVGNGGLVEATGGRGMKTADDSFPGSLSLAVWAHQSTGISLRQLCKYRLRTD